MTVLPEKNLTNLTNPSDFMSGGEEEEHLTKLETKSIRRGEEEQSKAMSTQRLGLRGWFHLKIVEPFLLILRRGVEPKQLSLSAALGITLGVFPICGVTVLLCGVAVALFGSIIHTPTLMLANFVATPIELSLVVPFLRLGEVITGGTHFPLTSDALWKVITGQASRDVLFGVVHVLLGWLVAAPLILGVLYIFFLPCFNVIVHKFSYHPPSPKKSQYPHPEIKLKIRKV